MDIHELFIQYLIRQKINDPIRNYLRDEAKCLGPGSSSNHINKNFIIGLPINELRIIIQACFIIKYDHHLKYLLKYFDNNITRDPEVLNTMDDLLAQNRFLKEENRKLKDSLILLCNK